MVILESYDYIIHRVLGDIPDKQVRRIGYRINISKVMNVEDKNHKARMIVTFLRRVRRMQSSQITPP